MKLALLGSTGQVGKAVLEEALNAGFEVTTLARFPEKLDDYKNRIKIVKGNLLDKEAVLKVLEGCNVVINAAGGVKEPNQFEKFQKIGFILINAMKSQKINRLITISGAVTKLPGERLEFKRKLMSVFVSMFFKEMKSSQEALTPIIVNSTDILWTIVRPAVVAKGKGTGKIRAKEKTLPGTKILLEDLGKFMVEQVTSTKWINKAPLVVSEFA